jgi:F-type H+-transporting ATPase subunit a
MPFIGALALFILIGNLMGLVPGLESPTGYLVVPLGCALSVFVYYNYAGLRAQGIVSYVKHFMGPVWWLSFLMFPIEIISHLARILSLTVRLYANMVAGDLLVLVFFSLFPFGLPLVFIALHLGVAFIQAYLFMVLPLIYLSQAVSHDEVTA